MDELIQRLLSRVGSVREKRSVAELAEFQDRWGLQLSDFFVRLYSEVGDGGFGPGYAGIATIEHLEVELNDAAGDPDNDWPTRFVEFAQYGCSQCAGIHLGDLTNPIHYIDGDGGQGDLFDSVPAYHDSLESYFREWLSNRESKPELTSTEQGGAGQPATRSESK